MKSALQHIISIGDAFSQFLGRLIPVRADGEWQCWTMSANESISGAAYRWNKTHGWGKPVAVINTLAKIVSFGKDDNHCFDAFYNDYLRSGEYREMVEILMGESGES